MNNTQPLPERILSLIQIFIAGYDFKKKNFSFDERQKTEFFSLWKSILEELVRSPGTLIILEDKTERKFAQEIIDRLWSLEDRDVIFDEITSGGYSCFLVNTIGDYIDRAKILKPTFISINTQDFEFNVYFEEAMKAWLFGLNSAALILCGAIIEKMIKTELLNLDPKILYNIESKKNISKGETNKNLCNLINLAFFHKIIDSQGKETAHRIRKFRNNAVHKLEIVSEEQTYRAILDTKQLIEKVWSNPRIF
jgi:Domain of unknown function (DUF4145)